MQLADVKTYKLERITVDAEFASLIAPPNPDELALLEANIRRDGIRDALVVWAEAGRVILLDGHTRLKVARTLGMAEVPVDFVKLPDRDSALLWAEEHQAGRRNLTDDQRTAIWFSIMERRSKVAQAEATAKARAAKTDPGSVSVKTPETGKRDTRAEVAKESGLPENKLRDFAEIKKDDPATAADIRAGKTTIRKANKKRRQAKKEAAGKFLANVKVGDLVVVWHTDEETVEMVVDANESFVYTGGLHSGIKNKFRRSTAKDRFGLRIVRLADPDDTKSYEDEKEQMQRAKEASAAAAQLVRSIPDFNPDVHSYDGVLSLYLSNLTLEHVRRIVAALTESAAREPTAVLQAAESAPQKLVLAVQVTKEVQPERVIAVRVTKDS